MNSHRMSQNDESYFLSHELQNEARSDETGGGKELEGMEGTDNIIRIYYVRKTLFAMLGEKRTWV